MCVSVVSLYMMSASPCERLANQRLHCLLQLFSQECAKACWRAEGCHAWNIDRSEIDINIIVFLKIFLIMIFIWTRESGTCYLIKGSEVSQRRDTCCNSGQMICGAAGGDCDDGDVGDDGYDGYDGDDGDGGYDGDDGDIGDGGDDGDVGDDGDDDKYH